MGESIQTNTAYSSVFGTIPPTPVVTYINLGILGLTLCLYCLHLCYRLPEVSAQHGTY